MPKKYQLDNSDTFIPDSELPTPTDSDILPDELSEMLEESYVGPKKKMSHKLETRHCIQDKKRDAQPDIHTMSVNESVVTKEELDDVKVDLTHLLRMISNVMKKIDDSHIELNRKIDKISERIDRLEETKPKTVDDTSSGFILANIDNEFNKRMDSVLELVDKRLDQSKPSAIRSNVRRR